MLAWGFIFLDFIPMSNLFLQASCESQVTGQVVQQGKSYLSNLNDNNIVI